MQDEHILCVFASGICRRVKNDVRNLSQGYGELYHRRGKRVFLRDGLDPKGFRGEVMAMRLRMLLSSVAVLATMLLASCSGHYTCGVTFGSSSCGSAGSGGIGQGGGGINGTPAAFDFFVDGGEINAATLDTSGSFALISNFAPPGLATGGVGGMVIVQKQWLYVSLGTSIQGFSINGKDGALTALTGSPFVTNSTESSAITADPAGKFLFLSAANDHQVVVFAINQTTGSLTAVGTFPIGFFAGEATTDGLGKYLYVTAGNLGGEVAAFAIGSTGSLTALAGSPFSINIAELKGEPTGKFLLGITGNGANNGFTSDNHVYVFSIDQSGVITQTGSPFATVYTPSTLTVHPNGIFVYTFNQTVTGTSPTEGLQFDTTTGALKFLTGSPFASLTAPSGQFDQSGAYLFMHPGTSVSVASVNTTTGALTSIATPIANVGSPVGWAVTDPH
jgi:Lactonase, 7-bladed beta-propeller